ncbi:DNA topoisomerase 3 [Coprothermobacteraceae bacterium]|nr:DNA topoisomerase 3 [Coprothermobacteraceae bacterium]
MTLIVTEKPSVARQIASALGKPTSRKTFLKVGDYVITYAFGHLLQFGYPEAYGEHYKKWRLEDLPIVPREWKLIPISKSAQKQLEEIRKLWQEADEVISATDAGREGELIFRLIKEHIGLEKPVRRLWLQSLTPEEIREELGRMRDLSELERLYQSALARAKADWLVGINASRAFTLVTPREVFSIGRVQTPTLALLVDREKEIQQFVPRIYFKVRVGFSVNEHLFWAESLREYEEQDAKALAAELVGQTLQVTHQELSEKKAMPPLLPDLGDLQKFASRAFKWSAQKTMKVLQSLYEKALITYPRTDSRFLPTDMKKQVRSIAKALNQVVQGNWVLVESLNNAARIFNDAKVTDHFAIIPTGKVQELKGDEQRMYEYIVARFLAAFYPPAVEIHQTTDFAYGDHKFRHYAVHVREPSWYALLGGPQSEELLPDLQAVQVNDARAEKRQTQPPPRYTDGTLIAAMETGGRVAEDEEIAQILKEKGIGTPATRAEIIERLVEMGYVQRHGTQLIPTTKGIMLIDALREVKLESLTQPELTGEWERRLRLIESGEETPQAFMWAIEEYVRQIIETLKKEESAHLLRKKQNMPIARCPFCDGFILEGQKSFYCSNWKEGCSFRVWKNMNGGVLTADDVRRLVAEGRTRMKRFKSKAGRTYKAFVVLDMEEKKVAVEYPQRAASSSAADTELAHGDGEVAKPSVDEVKKRATKKHTNTKDASSTDTKGTKKGTRNARGRKRK